MRRWIWQQNNPSERFLTVRTHWQVCSQWASGANGTGDMSSSKQLVCRERFTTSSAGSRSWSRGRGACPSTCHCRCTSLGHPLVPTCSPRKPIKQRHWCHLQKFKHKCSNADVRATESSPQQMPLPQLPTFSYTCLGVTQPNRNSGWLWVKINSSGGGGLMVEFTVVVAATAALMFRHCCCHC